MSEPALVIVAGGTSESREAVERLVSRGMRVIWSQATTLTFQLTPHPRLRRRVGRLTARGWMRLIRATGATAILDAGHPFATELRQTLQVVATRTGITLLRLRRAEMAIDETAVVVPDHDVAARMACELVQRVPGLAPTERYGKARILVTVGTRHLGKYVDAARQAQVELYARVLDAPESREALAALGCDEGHIVFGRGPFSVERNLQHLEQCGATLLVSKDSGREGGLPEKLEAARRRGCRVLIVARPRETADALETVDQVIERLRQVAR